MPRIALSLSKSDRRLVKIGTVSLFLALVAFAPASLLTPALSAAGVQFRSLEGGVWNGRIRGLTASDVYLGDASFRFAPMQLFSGRLGVHLKTSGGAAVGRGVAAVGLGGARLQDVDAQFDLSAIKRYSIFGLAYSGSIRTQIKSLAWSEAGCQSASGEIWTDALDGSLKKLSGEGADLMGALSCKDKDLAVAFDGRNSKGEAAITVRITPDLTYALTASVRPAEDGVRESLQLIGFQANDDALVYNAYGPLKGLGT